MSKGYVEEVELIFEGVVPQASKDMRLSGLELCSAPGGVVR